MLDLDACQLPKSDQCQPSMRSKTALPVSHDNLAPMSALLLVLSAFFSIDQGSKATDDNMLATYRPPFQGFKLERVAH